MKYITGNDCQVKVGDMLCRMYPDAMGQALSGIIIKFDLHMDHCFVFFETREMLWIPMSWIGVVYKPTKTKRD